MLTMQREAFGCVVAGDSTLLQQGSSYSSKVVLKRYFFQLPLSRSALRSSASSCSWRRRPAQLVVCERNDMAATKLSNDRPSFGRLESMEVEKQSAAFSAKKEYFSEPSVCSRAGKRTNGSPLSLSEMEKTQLASTPEEQPIELGLRDLNAVKAFMNIPAWADAVAERGMHKRRTFYTHDDWLRHRSSTRHARHFLSSLSSRVILSLGPPVGIITLIASVIAAYNSAISTGLLPPYFSLLHASALPYELSAPALALLLVFRTEASYSRYDEARKTWTKVISGTKDLARQSVAWIQEPEDSNQKEFLLRYIEAFPVALKCHLLYGSDTWQELKDILDEDDLALVMCSEHRPNCLIQLMTQSLRQVLLQDNERSLLDANMSQFNDSISVCERLIRTPIPLSYTRLTSRILVMWHLTLPVVLWDDCKLMVIPATFISAACLFCIEEVGVLIEEPFPILPLDRMCAKARENIKELIKLQVQAREHLITKARKKQAARVIIGARDYN